MGTQYSRSDVQQYGWKKISSIKSSQSALGTDKSAATVNALASTKTIIFSPDDGTVAFEGRFKCDGTDGDSNVVNVYAMRGDSDHYILIGTLTLTTGTQTDGTYLFIDTISWASPLWANTIEVMSGADNSIARFAMNTQGYTKFLYVATTLNSTELILETARV